MKSYKNAVVALFSVVALSLATAGCDRTVSQTEKTKVNSDGTVKKEEKTVTEHPDGTVTKTEEEKKTAPSNP